MTPEYIIGAIISIVLGWGGLTWRKAESAKDAANSMLNQIDRLELKIAEKYITKIDFDSQMNRLFSALARFEIKLDAHVYNQVSSLDNLHTRLQEQEDTFKEE